MLSWIRKEKGDKTGLELETDNEGYGTDSEEVSTEEQDAIAKTDSDLQYALSARESECDELGFSIEDLWEDDYYMWKGGGLHWITHFAYRNKRDRKRRPNSEDNFIFNALNTQHANITSETPLAIAKGVGSDDEEIAKKLSHAMAYNDKRNHFSELWKKLVYDFIGSGPTIMMITWDNDWQGGRGPEKWVGDVRLSRVDKWEMYFDPSILDLQQDLQLSSYVIRRVRKKLEYIREKWEKGKYISRQSNEDELINEGGDSKQAYVEEYWHRGFPWFVTEERKKELREKALQLEEDGELEKAKDYYDSADGNLAGVHVAYISDSVLLEYRPYEYEHGEYPFVFTTRYYDEKNQWGFGETRNVKIPQVMHNKTDEIELAGYVGQALGGAYYQNGAINPKQIDHILENSGKANMMLEVDNINGIQQRTGVQVPASLPNYKEHKQRIIETVSSNVPAQQMSLGKDAPLGTIQELGMRSDIKTKQISNKLEDFLIRVNKQRIELFAQFYTEQRYYRIKGTDGTIEEGTINSNDITKEHEEITMNEIEDPTTGELIMMPESQKERFVPEYDVEVVVISEKPTDRNYYTNLGMSLYEKQLLTPEDLLETLDSGKLPPNEDILKRVYAQQPIMGIAAQIQELDPELQQMITQQMVQMVQGIIQQTEQAEQGPQQK